MLSARGLLEGIPGQAGQSPQNLRLRRRIGGQSGDLQVQRACQILGSSCLFVAREQRLQGLLVPRNVLQYIVPVGDGPVEVVDLVLQDFSDAPDQSQFFLRVGGVAEVVLEHLDQPRLVARPFEDALETNQGVPVSGHQLENLRRSPRSGRQVGQALLVQDQQAPQKIDLLGVDAGCLDLAAQEGGQLGPLLGPLVRLHYRAQRDRVLGIERENLTVDCGCAIGRVEFVEVQPSQATQDLGAGFGLAGRCIFGQNGRHLFPTTGLLQDALASLARPLIAGVQLEHLPPHRQRAIDVAQLGLGDDRHLFQARKQLGRWGAGRSRVVEREFQHVH